ncbi:hypothetical protein FA13DRAFT_1754487 [Coprinellus micaceus]|uniref:C2H2-type domain-containing protein n=1 Tax=Coprinellus micaceus TaxID=71717 RepID=A0A4Y7TEF2_COPMI|nr:hypothetical protein FA13DRAFT_1754487 [Coprinellus micaceus]
MTETPEKVVEEQVNPEEAEAQRVAEAAPGPDSEVPSTESSSSRPMTRSQTGRATKRQNPEEAATESKKRTTPSTKRQKTVSRQASASAENVDAPAPAENASTSDPTPPPPPIAPPPVVEAPIPPSASRITFLEVSTAADAQGERRISRSRAVFPVPVPNLTKKSRGRRVPTSEAMEATPAAQPEKRVYVCKADGCGKCFHRGEHLKRHIRSIHTHEKPFKCSFPSCGKFFNRHDNLLQHLKVHKDTKAPRNQKTSTPNASEAGTPPPGPQSQLPEPESPTSEAPDSPVVPRPRTIYDHQPNLYAGYVNTGPFESPAESLRFQVTNMAVSSLRTEIPQSPTEPHQPPPFPWHHPEAMQDQLTY